MANDCPTISNICRLCLSQNEQYLLSATDTIDSLLTTLEIERFTGIQIDAECIPCSICTECNSTLKKCIVFRTSCLRNDILFKRLFSDVFISADNAEQNVNDSKIESIEFNIILEQEGSTNHENGYQSSLEDSSIQYIPNISKDRTISSDENCHENDIDSSETTVYSYEKHVECPDKQRTNESTNIMNKEKKAVCDNVPAQPCRSSRRKYLCSICGKFVCHLTIHVASHGEETKHTCPHCTVQIRDFSNLKRHIKAVHLKTIIISCEVCGKGFTHKNNYKSHMRSHHDIGETHKCKVCLKEFNHPGSLRQHFQRLHYTEKYYTCTTCGKQHKTSYQLRQHRKVHSTDQPYACSLCPKRFKSSFAKKTHELTHSGITFECVLCKKSYRYKSLLSMHMKKVHQHEHNKDTTN